MYNTGQPTSARAISAATNPRAFKADFNAPSSSTFNANGFAIYIAAIIATTAKGGQPRRMGSVYAMPKTLPP
jgi:hypothetical protein